MYYVYFIRGHKQGCILHHCSWPGWIKSSLLFWSYNMYWSPSSSTLKYGKYIDIFLLKNVSSIAKAILAMVSCMVMGTVLTRQLPESPCHSSTQRPTFSPCFIWRGYPPLMWPSGPRWPTWMFSLCDCGREWLYNGWNCLFCRKPKMINVLDTHSYLKLCMYACNCLVHIIWKFFLSC